MKTTHVSIGLQNPKTPINVDAVMRAGGCYKVDKVFYSGTRYDRAAAFQTQKPKVDTKSAAESIPLNRIDDLLEVVPKGHKIICVDLVVGATPLPEFEHPEIAFYIFGPEDGTIDQALIDRADSVVYVPTVGCMNLAASVNVLLYDRLAKAMQKGCNLIQAGDELIKQSRDNRNRVKVKA
ncbi:TrmH family RNA methyltransferase [Parashewanella curva]|uniref:TrmH family RNA methyltransferase n=1 Tax=Parashewanella curva TaxID=2338552 RepID=A0A3L8PX70_9GAMM|nr:RNA methyltransferase [Parashewanella curva]RLV59911.1 TrmH family RNA methyltransferase [Parashewanella curva]